MSALLNKRGGKGGKKKTTCAYCGQTFWDLEKKEKQEDSKVTNTVLHMAQELLEEHKPRCENVGKSFRPDEVMPKPGENILKFKKYGHLFKSPF